MQLFGEQVTNHLRIVLVLLPSYLANAVKAAESTGICGSPKGHQLIRYNVHCYVL